ncbi:MAG: hypothetical protein HGA80_04780 [Candidatus Omnitrophica bacterium]|nr:hypothetical protein [Candidatus Omnitrophota bacterium]
MLIVGPNASYAQSAFVASLPEPGTMVTVSKTFVPVLVKGLVVHPDQPLNFDFIVDSGNDSPEQALVAEQSQRMAQYFLAAITVPEEQLWVNLSPYEKDRIIENELGQTVLGRDMLAQDYVLKQFTASAIYPENRLGQTFWARIYKEAQEKFGMTDIPVDTFNKVWIMPGKAEVFEKDNAVYVTEARLKVMLDSDYVAQSEVSRQQSAAADEESASSTAENRPPAADPIDTKADLTKALIRQVVLPAIEKEVNEGQNFAVIRQIYHAAILATWYRDLVQDTLLSRAYVGKNLVAGVTTPEKELKDKIYQRYIAAYKKGVFNLVKEEPDPVSGEAIPRQYFSGGVAKFGDIKIDRAMQADNVTGVGKTFRVDFAMSNPIRSEEAEARRAAVSEDERNDFITDNPSLLAEPLDLAMRPESAAVDKGKGDQAQVADAAEDTTKVLLEKNALIWETKPLSLTLSPEMALINDVSIWIKSHPIFTAGVPNDAVDEDMAMVTEILQWVSAHPPILNGMLAGLGSSLLRDHDGVLRITARASWMLLLMMLFSGVPFVFVDLIDKSFHTTILDSLVQVFLLGASYDATRSLIALLSGEKDILEEGYELEAKDYRALIKYRLKKTFVESNIFRIRYLSALGSANAINSLAKYMDDPDLRKEVVEALKKLGATDIVNKHADDIARKLNQAELRSNYYEYNDLSKILFKDFEDARGGEVYIHHYTPEKQSGWVTIGESGHEEEVGGIEQIGTYSYGYRKIWVVDNPGETYWQESSPEVNYWEKVNRADSAMSAMEYALSSPIDLRQLDEESGIVDRVPKFGNASKEEIVRILNTGHLDVSRLADTRLRDFITFLRANDLEDIIIFGGAIRDSITGSQVNDIDFTIRMDLQDGDKTGVATQATRTTYEKAQAILGRLAHALGFASNQFYNSINPAMFNGVRLHFVGPQVIHNPKGDVYIKWIIYDKNTDAIEISQTTPELLLIGMSPDGKLLNYKNALRHWLKGYAILSGDTVNGRNLTELSILKLLRLKHELGLTISNQDMGLIRKVLQNRYADVLSNPKLVKKDVAKIIETALDPEAAIKDLESLGFISYDSASIHKDLINKNLGGVDVKDIPISHKDGSARVRFNEEALRNVIEQGFNGFTPVIINITPFQSPLLLLGVNEPQPKDEKA